MICPTDQLLFKRLLTSLNNSSSVQIVDSDKKTEPACPAANNRQVPSGKPYPLSYSLA